MNEEGLGEFSAEIEVLMLLKKLRNVMIYDIRIGK